MKTKNSGIAFLVISIAGILACCKGGRSEAEKAKIDSLFLGVSLGMGKQEFYDHCWDLNKKGLITHGPTNTNVEYVFMHPSFRDSVIMRFYPSFHEDKIYEMPVLYTYRTWAPWNKQFWADTLLTAMVAAYKDYYGSDFKVLEHKTMGKVYYQMLGKRRINLFKKDDQFVQAVFTDLKVEKEIKEKSSKDAEKAE